MSEHRQFVIIGTAPSWQRTPWKAPNVLLASLNDAYQLGPRGFGECHEWYDPHPLNHFIFPETKALYAHQVPPGHYVRPKGHLEWLASRPYPVYLQPDYLTQHPNAAEWQNAKPFPRQQIVEHFGQYFTSTPQWMMAFALMRGFSDFAVYGIHLATEQEYREQRPGFEFLIGRVLGKGKLSVTVKDGMRHYETADGHVSLPEESPVLQSKFQYAFETRPSGFMAPVEWQLHKLSIKRDRTIQALGERPWWQPIGAIREPGPDGKERRRVCSTTTLQNDLRYLNAAILDTQMELQRLARQAGA
jgi:hypothetical protein